MINSLILDPAASTGYTLVRISDKTAEIYDYGYINIDTTSKYSGDWCIDLMNQLKEIITINNVTDIAVEDYFSSSKFKTGCNINYFYRAAIHILSRQLELPYTVLNISEWKKFVAGRSTPTKEQKKKWGKQSAKKLFIQQALWENYGIRFPNHSLSQKTNKPIIFRYDIVDAVAQAIFHCKNNFQVENICTVVEPPPDIQFKKKPKNIFNYGGNDGKS